MPPWPSCPLHLLVDGACRIENIPQISDVTLCLKILEQLGAGSAVSTATLWKLIPAIFVPPAPPMSWLEDIRASYYLIGARWAGFGQAEVAMPGGCNFGVRPIDQHVKGFTALGARSGSRGRLYPCF